MICNYIQNKFVHIDQQFRHDAPKFCNKTKILLFRQRQIIKIKTSKQE